MTTGPGPDSLITQRLVDGAAECNPAARKQKLSQCFKRPACQTEPALAAAPRAVCEPGRLRTDAASGVTDGGGAVANPELPPPTLLAPCGPAAP